MISSPDVAGEVFFADVWVEWVRWWPVDHHASWFWPRLGDEGVPVSKRLGRWLAEAYEAYEASGGRPGGLPSRPPVRVEVRTVGGDECDGSTERADRDMSFDLYWRPLPRAKPSVGYSLKWPIARGVIEHDGSCRVAPFVLTASVIPWLEGVADAGPRDGELAREARRLIECIRANPQGVRVWIGEEDDA